MSETSTPNAAAAARALLAVRRGGPRLRALPAPLAPKTLAEAYAIQYALLRELNSSIAGWKASLFDAENGICAPLPANAVRDAPAYLVPARLPTQQNTRFGIEAEVAFRLGNDLPPLRAGARYDRETVSAALVSAHAVIEVVVSRYVDADVVTQLERVADNFMNELLIVGPSCTSWRSLALAQLPLELRIDGKPVFQARGGHPLNDPLRPVVWLANHLSEFGQGLRAGEIVTTGSWNGVHHVTLEQSVSAWFDGLGTSIVRF
ncbi:MAG: fumarylacetoacetate hydrolase family protein [Proteobacteria bacterium]|nr:fumarylacetoacetate hydrolase family protein [Pseudomonadota bacterium]